MIYLAPFVASALLRRECRHDIPRLTVRAVREILATEDKYVDILYGMMAVTLTPGHRVDVEKLFLIAFLNCFHEGFLDCSLAGKLFACHDCVAVFAVCLTGLVINNLFVLIGHYKGKHNI